MVRDGLVDISERSVISSSSASRSSKRHHPQQHLFQPESTSNLSSLISPIKRRTSNLDRRRVRTISHLDASRLKKRVKKLINFIKLIVLRVHL